MFAEPAEVLDPGVPQEFERRLRPSPRACRVFCSQAAPSTPLALSSSSSSSSHNPMLLLRALSLFLSVQQSCRAFHARSSITSARTRQCRSHQPPLNMNMNNPAEVPEKLRLANLKAHNEVWDSRRDMARATLSAAKAVRKARESLAGPADESKDRRLLEEGKGSLVISAIALAVAAATIRLGGRAALISVRVYWGTGGLIYYCQLSSALERGDFGCCRLDRCVIAGERGHKTWNPAVLQQEVLVHRTHVCSFCIAWARAKSRCC